MMIYNFIVEIHFDTVDNDKCGIQLDKTDLDN